MNLVVRVQAEQCATCIFRPGNLMYLRPGRVKDMVSRARRRDSAIICHERLGHAFGNGKGAVCRGFFDRYPTTPLALAQQLGIVAFVTSRGPDEAPGQP